MKNRFFKKYLPGVMSAVLLSSTVALTLPQEVAAKNNEGNISIENLNIAEDAQIEALFSQNSDLYKFLEGLENLPIEIANQGPKEVAKWLTDQTGVTVLANGENLLVPSLAELESELNTDFTLNDRGQITTMITSDCVIAAGLMVGSVGFPLSKILKLKEAISLLGGMTKTIDRIYTQYKKLKSENWRTGPAIERAVTDVSKSLPKDLTLAFLDFFSVGNFLKQCFGD